MSKWKLKRVVQCEKCPWRVDTNPYDIPNGYSLDKHRDLRSTIANPSEITLESRSAMACHETHDAHCIGWLVNQLGRGNNIGLRLQMLGCKNRGQIKTIGEQHPDFESTLPE